MSLSGACLAHCVGTAVFVATLASASSILLAPAIHETGLALAILLGAIALGHGALKRGAILPIAIGSLGLGIMAGALSIPHRSEEHTSELQSLMRISYAVFCLKKKKN